MDVLLEGLKITLVGISIVFVVLILISLLISAFIYINKFEAKREANINAKSQINVPVKESPVIETQSEVDELELIAVISSVIASSLGTTTDKLKVRSIRRTKTAKSNWQINSKIGY